MIERSADHRTRDGRLREADRSRRRKFLSIRTHCGKGAAAAAVPPPLALCNEPEPSRRWPALLNYSARNAPGVLVHYAARCDDGDDYMHWRISVELKGPAALRFYAQTLRWSPKAILELWPASGTVLPRTAREYCRICI